MADPEFARSLLVYCRMWEDPNNEPVSEVAHVGWMRLRAALRTAGLAGSLVTDGYYDRIGDFAWSAPTPSRVLSVLAAHFGLIASDPGREGRWLSYRHATSLEGPAGAAPVRGSLEALCRRLGAEVPELGELKATVDDGYVCLASTHLAAEVELLDRASVSVDELVEGTNILLARSGAEFRFLPLAASAQGLGYLAASRDQARVLSKAALWDESVLDLDAFAHWQVTGPTSPSRFPGRVSILPSAPVSALSGREVRLYQAVSA